MVSLPMPTRINALAAVPGGMAALSPEWFALLQHHALPDQPVSTRALAAEVLGQAQLSHEQLIALLDTVRAAGPMELPKLLQAYARSNDESLGWLLVTALGQASGRSTLRSEWLNPLLASFPESVRQKSQALLDTLHADTGEQRKQLDVLLGELKDGDVRRGQMVFNSTKAACASCHAIGYLGGHLGPDLTRIGQIRTGRDLLEAVVYPSASFVRSYEPVLVTTIHGDDSSGLLRRDDPDEVVLATGPETEIRIPRDEIAAIRPGNLSVMPGGLDEQLSRQELADLLAFLQATKW
jgi:putative heme-binding domain-containing protein